MVPDRMMFTCLGRGGPPTLPHGVNGDFSQLDSEKFASTGVYFTKISTPLVTQDIIMSKLDKRRKGVYGPPLGKNFIIFVDDINLPEKDSVGSQGAIELLRQIID